MVLQHSICQVEINFDLIKHESAREIIKKMLKINESERASLQDIIDSNWVTNNGKEIMNP